MVMERSVDLSDVEIVTEESSGSALSWSAIPPRRRVLGAWAWGRISAWAI